MKKGVTLLTVILLVIVIAILTTGVTLTSSTIVKEVTKSEFVTEYLTIQNKVTSYYNLNGKYPVENAKSLNIEDKYLYQVDGEDLTYGSYEMHVLNLDELNITDNKYGNKEFGNDVYAVSIKTGIVYYMAGFKHNGKLYYRVTDELSKGYDYSTYLQINETLIHDVAFMPNVTGYTNKPIRVNVKLPVNCTVTSVTTTASVDISSETIGTAYKLYVVNTGDIGTNYTINVKYSDENNISKEATYIVDKYDNAAPVVTVGSITSETMANGNTQYYLQNVKISDKFSGVDYVKYANTIVEDATYFKKNGEYVSPDVTILSLGQLNTYTIYVVDKAGNYTLLTKQ